MAATKKTGTAGAGEAAALPAHKAVVIPLPGALLEPVAQNRPRGRRPKNIIPMWRVRLEADPALQAHRLAAQRDLALEMRKACVGRVIEAQQHIMDCRKALKQAEEAEALVHAEWYRFDAEVKRLEYEQAALCRGAAT